MMLWLAMAVNKLVAVAAIPPCDCNTADGGYLKRCVNDTSTTSNSNNSNSTSFLPPSLTSPTAIAVSPDGQVYVGYAGDDMYVQRNISDRVDAADDGVRSGNVTDDAASCSVVRWDGPYTAGSDVPAYKRVGPGYAAGLVYLEDPGASDVSGGGGGGEGVTGRAASGDG